MCQTDFKSRVSKTDFFGSKIESLEQFLLKLEFVAQELKFSQNWENLVLKEQDFFFNK